MEDVADDAEDLARPMQALSTSAPTNDELPHHFTAALHAVAAQDPGHATIWAAVQSIPHDRSYVPRDSAVPGAVERHVPWTQLAAFTGYIVRRHAAGAEGRFPKTGASRVPSEYAGCIRWLAGRWSDEGDVLDAAAVRDGVVKDGDDAENGAEEGGAAVLERGRCARLGSGRQLAESSSMEGMR
ncbi:hypothetical protein FRC10_005267, partial [Ceratobasidium sp. 414]